jgi:hypothetical protein
MPEPEAYFAIGNRFWKRPVNWQELCDGIRWAAGGHMPLEISAPPSLVANLVSQLEKRRMILHLVNYAARQRTSIPSVEARVELPPGAAIQKINLLSPDQADSQTLPHHQSNSIVSFTVPRIETYSVITLNW